MKMTTDMLVDENGAPKLLKIADIIGEDSTFVVNSFNHSTPEFGEFNGRQPIEITITCGPKTVKLTEVWMAKGALGR